MRETLAFNELILRIEIWTWPLVCKFKSRPGNLSSLGKQKIVTEIKTLRKRWKRIFICAIFIWGNDKVTTIRWIKFFPRFVFFSFIAKIFHLISNVFANRTHHLDSHTVYILVTTDSVYHLCYFGKLKVIYFLLCIKTVYFKVEK